jgi:ribosomal-protein-alanine N-acetyltransferase
VNYPTHIEVTSSLAPPDMPEQPVLRTERLVLRPFQLADAADVQRLAGDREVASTTRLIPHPYPEGLAEQWISSLAALYAKGRSCSFAITRRDGTLMGAIGLSIEPTDRHAELGYWIGRPFWNQGYCTEAARAVLAFAFESLNLRRIYAHYMARNPASGRVMEKLGMQREGCLRQHRFKWGEYEDLILCGILKHEFSPLTEEVRSAE